MLAPVFHDSIRAAAADERGRGKRGMDGSQPAELMAAAVSGMDVERGNK